VKTIGIGTVSTGDAMPHPKCLVEKPDIKIYEGDLRNVLPAHQRSTVARQDSTTPEIVVSSASSLLGVFSLIDWVVASDRKEHVMAETWLPSLKTQTPQEGFDLATKLARIGVKVAQPSAEIRDSLSAAYDHDTAQLIASSQVIAIHFQTVAAANNYWRD
jgi:hypothetical protein